MINGLINIFFLKPIHDWLYKRARFNSCLLRQYLAQLAICPELANTLYGKRMELLNEITKMQIEMVECILPLSKYWR